MQKIYRTVKLDGVKAKSAGEYFGTLQESVTEAWREHLKTAKYSTHIALDDYYNDMPEKIDAFIEAYIACNEKIEDYSCNINAKNLTPLEYLKLIKAFAEDGRDEYCGDHSELHSCLDDILELIDSTIYKLRELHESCEMISLRDFIAEDLEKISEAEDTLKVILQFCDSKNDNETIEEETMELKLSDFDDVKIIDDLPSDDDFIALCKKKLEERHAENDKITCVCLADEDGEFIENICEL